MNQALHDTFTTLDNDTLGSENLKSPIQTNFVSSPKNDDS